MAEKLSGMEMMLQSLLKSMGFNIDEFKSNIVSTITDFQTAIKALQVRLNTIDARLEKIEIALAINAPQGDNETLRIPPSQKN